jgi:hypothetical protein
MYLIMARARSSGTYASRLQVFLGELSPLYTCSSPLVEVPTGYIVQFLPGETISEPGVGLDFLLASPKVFATPPSSR